MELDVKFSFDDKSYRHFMNGHESVLHCHHYMTLTTRLAEDFGDLGAVGVLRDVAEDTMRPLFDDYIAEHAVASVEDRLEVARQYYSVMGLGQMEATSDGSGGEVRLLHSHLDEGWIKKWGKREQPVNHFTCGYVAAMFGAAFGSPPGSFGVTETTSIVSGAPASIFVVRQGKKENTP